MSLSTSAPDQPAIDALDVEPPATDKAPNGTPAPSEGFPFEAMNLKVDDRLQMQLPAKLSSERIAVRLIGYVPGHSLLVSTPVASNGVRVQLLEGESLVMRVFSSQNAFGFASTVTRVCKLPFNYLHLSFPTKIQGTVIRKAPRVKTKIIATVTPDKEGAVGSPAVISNISANGALLDARRTLLDKGDTLSLTFSIKLHDISNQLTVNAMVCTVFEAEGAVQNERALAHFGLQFVDLKPYDFMILQGLIYQQMIERPQSLV